MLFIQATFKGEYNKDINIITYVEYVLNLRNELGYKCKVMTFFPN